MNHLIAPYQGELKDLLLNEHDAEQLKLDSESFPSITLSQRQQCDLELLLNGALSPLTGFMNEDVYNSVVCDARLPDGVLWPIPYYLDIDEKQAESLKLGSKISLCDTEGFMPAVLTVESIWRPDKEKEALEVYGTLDQQHPGVDYLFNSVKSVYVGGTVHGVQLPFHYDFEKLRHTPVQLRQLFETLGWKNIVATQFHPERSGTIGLRMLENFCRWDGKC